MYDHCMQNGGVEIQGWQTPGGGQYAVCVFEDGTIGKAFQFYLDGTKVPPDEGDSQIDRNPSPSPSGDGGAESVHPMYDHCMRNGGVELQTWINAETGGEYAVCVFEDGSLGRTFQFWADGVKVPPAEGDYPRT
jgi:putative hemolysin